MRTIKSFSVPPYGMGAKEDKKDSRDFQMKDIFVKKAMPFRKKVSYRKEMSPIKNQGQRGACESFGGAAFKEWQEKKQRKLKTFYDFSEEFLYDQIKLPGGGAFTRDMMKALQTNGICQEKMMPYINVPDEKDDIIWKPSKAAIANAKNYKIESYARLGSIDDICRSIDVNGPCVSGIDWAYDWFWPDALEHDSDGFPLMKKFTGGLAGGHLIVPVGYDYDNRLFEVRNHWNIDWGFFGYFKLHFRYRN
jgi:hypothetical protein